MFEYSRLILSKYSDVRTSKNKIKDSHWTEPSIFILLHLFIKINNLQRNTLPCILVTLKVLGWRWKLHVNVCQIPHKSWQVVATWKNKKSIKYSEVDRSIKYLEAEIMSEYLKFLKSFGKYSNIRISVVALEIWWVYAEFYFLFCSAHLIIKNLLHPFLLLAAEKKSVSMDDLFSHR